MSLQLKKKKKAPKENAIKIIPMTDKETDEEEDIEEEEDDAGGMYLEKEDMLVIYKALKNYKPGTEDEDHKPSSAFFTSKLKSGITRFVM